MIANCRRETYSCTKHLIFDVGPVNALEEKLAKRCNGLLPDTSFDDRHGVRSRSEQGPPGCKFGRSRVPPGRWRIDNPLAMGEFE
jgi:hypothetical protein